MIDLIENLKVIAAQAGPPEALIIKAAIQRIKQLEAKLSDYEEDITDWQNSVATQMKPRNGNK